MKKKIENKYDRHPFSSDYCVISQAFDALMKEQDACAMTLRGYKGVTKEANDQLEYENERIKEVKRKVLSWSIENQNEHGMKIFFKQ